MKKRAATLREMLSACLLGAALSLPASASDNRDAPPLPPPIPLQTPGADYHENVMLQISDAPTNPLPTPAEAVEHLPPQFAAPAGPHQGERDVIDRMEESLRATSQSEAKTLDQLHEQIQRLGEIMRNERRRTAEINRRAEMAEKRAEQIAEEALQMQQEMLQKITAPPLHEPAGTVITTHPIPPRTSPAAAAPPSPDVATEPPPVAPPREPTPAAIPPIQEARQATDAAVDRLALADSLFGAGEYQLSLEIYITLVDEAEFRHDNTWIRYQIANCHRNLENIQQAERYYREVAADEQHEFLAENSRWWLATMQQRYEMNTRLKQINAVMQQIRKASP